jgi:hypothetical protein
LIQVEAQAHNIDSKNHSIKFDYCPGALRVWEFCNTIPLEADTSSCPGDVGFGPEPDIAPHSGAQEIGVTFNRELPTGR